MRAVAFGSLPLISVSSAARFVVFGLIGAALAGCASTSQAPSYAGAAVAKPVAERQWKVEIEDDGKPAQAPPVRRMRPEEDDPTQPWSQNYGGKNPAPPPPAPIQSVPSQQTPWPRPVEAAHRQRISDADADVLIARAVNAHEMRRP